MHSPSLELDLTDKEAALLDDIEFDADKLEGRGHWLRNGELVLKLVQSLLARDAIPDHRWDWLVSGDHNFNGRGSSRKDTFERNGTSGNDIPRHAHFLPYLRYFIYGPNLPSAVISAFHTQVQNCGHVTSSDVIPLGRFTRQQTRAAGLDRKKAAEEFFKLALAYDLSIGTAMAIRKQVLQT